MNNWLKRNGIHLAVTGVFLAISFLYFTPAFEGKTLGQSDVVGAESTQKEINDYRAKDTTILWTNQLFGGMPTFQIWAPYPDNATTWVVKGLTAIFPNPIYTVLLLLLGTYFLFIVLRLNPWLAAAGALRNGRFKSKACSSVSRFTFDAISGSLMISSRKFRSSFQARIAFDCTSR